jgi:hypothetical protein
MPLPPIVAFGPASDDAARLCSPNYPKRFKVLQIVVRRELYNQAWMALDEALRLSEKENGPQTQDRQRVGSGARDVGGG